MRLAQVIGTVWATRKDERLGSYKLLVVQPVGGHQTEAPIIAADSIGAGIGERVLITQGGAARWSLGGEPPVDAAVVGIVDGEDIPEITLGKKE